MRKFLILLLLPIFISCAGFQIDSESQNQRLGFKLAIAQLIDNGHITKDELSNGIQSIKEDLSQDVESDVKELIKSRLIKENQSETTKVLIDEFAGRIVNNAKLLAKTDSVEEYQKQAMIVLGWVEDTLKLY
jgi:hypothetical protein